MRCFAGTRAMTRQHVRWAAHNHGTLRAQGELALCVFECLTSRH
jgi:hypothetical protein